MNDQNVTFTYIQSPAIFDTLIEMRVKLYHYCDGAILDYAMRFPVSELQMLKSTSDVHSFLAQIAGTVQEQYSMKVMTHPEHDPALFHRLGIGAQIHVFITEALATGMKNKFR